MQKHVNLVDLVKSFPTNILLQNLASIQKRTSRIKFAHLAEKQEKGSLSNLSTKVGAPAREDRPGQGGAPQRPVGDGGRSGTHDRRWVVHVYISEFFESRSRLYERRSFNQILIFNIFRDLQDLVIYTTLHRSILQNLATYSITHLKNQFLSNSAKQFSTMFVNFVF